MDVPEIQCECHLCELAAAGYGPDAYLQVITGHIDRIGWAVQVVWPDRQGRFPWERGFEARYEGVQPLLWLPRDDHPPGTWTRIDDPLA